jgi:Ca-activated chloride channel family protein
MKNLSRLIAAGVLAGMAVACAGPHERQARSVAAAGENAAIIAVAQAPGEMVATADGPKAAVPAPLTLTGARIAGVAPPVYGDAPGSYYDQGRDRFASADQNAFKAVAQEPVSTFSIDVDTASYSFMRASLARGVLPTPQAVRAEELINYFAYDYPAPAASEQPFSTTVDVFPSPWTTGRKIVRVGIKGYELPAASLPRANLVFLIDTSGSMNAPGKLPLVQRSLLMLLERLGPEDSISIVTYAGTAGVALPPTPVRDKARIAAVIEALGSGGSTAGAEGIRQAYALAARNLDPKGVNRVILATDGDFNVGITSTDALKGYVEREREKGIFLSVLGFGMGNYNDALMQALAQNGNGNAAYIDTLNEARKVLVEEATSTLFVIAKDVKIQIEFNPATVAEYRLVGYETRMLKREDFDNDRVDAGEVGSGQSVTALYEIVPVGGASALGSLRYAAQRKPAPSVGEEYGFVKIRYKRPDASVSNLLSTPIDPSREVARFEAAPRDARFAVGVATFAELLRGGRYTGTMTYADVLAMVTPAVGRDEFGYRAAFVQLVRDAKSAASMARLGE